MAGYIGPAPVPQATQTREVFTLSSTQTTVGTGGYTPGFIDVYLNGAKLAPADFTATNGSDIVLASAAAANDILEVVAFQEFTVVDQTFSGDITFTGADYNVVWDASDNALEFGDNAKAIFGAGSDLQIYHNGSASFIDDAGNGYLNIRGNGVSINKYTGETMALFVADGAATLYHDNAVKLATTSTGINVTGTVTDDGAVHDGDVTFTGASYSAVWDKSDNALEFGDNAKAVFGAGSDLQIYHDSSHSYIVDDGTGNLYISTNGNGIVMQASLSENMFAALPNGAVSLYYDNSVKIATTSSGVDVTGTVTADGLTVDGDAAITSGTDAKLTINDAISEVGTGNLALQTTNSAGSALKPMGFRAEDIRFATGSSERVRINDDGLGVGMTPDSAVELSVSGAVGPTNGSAGSPTHTFYSDADTGMFRAAANTLGLSTSGTERMRIDSSGGILFYEDTGSTAKLGWSATNERLTLYGSDYQFEINDGSNQPFFLRAVSDGSFRIHLNGTGDSIIVDSSSRVGIGTSSMSSFYATKFVVNVGDEDGITIYNDGANERAYIMFADATSGTGRYSGQISYDHNNDQMSFTTAANTAVTIDSSNDFIVGAASSSGDTDNFAKVTAGHFTTANGRTSVASTGVATTLHSFSSNAGNFIVSALASGTGNIEDNTTAIVHINANSTSKITTLLAGSRVVLSMSGANLQVTQSIFGNANIDWSVMRIR